MAVTPVVEQSANTSVVGIATVRIRLATAGAGRTEKEIL